MNISHIRALLAVADTGSLTAAAEKLGFTQSGVSQAVSALEDHLEVQLLTRDRRGADLTDIGEQAVKEGREILARLDAIYTHADTARGVERTRIRLAGFPSLFVTLLPPLLRRFQRRHPSVEVIALEASDDELDTWFRSEAIDVAVVMIDGSKPVDAFLGTDEWVAVTPKSHPLAHAYPEGVPFEVLAAEPFVLATGGCALHARTLAEARGFSLEDIRVEIKDWASAATLVREGLGVTLIPESAAPSDLAGTKRLRLAEPIERRFGLKATPAAASRPEIEAFLANAEAVAPRSTEGARPRRVA